MSHFAARRSSFLFAGCALVGCLLSACGGGGIGGGDSDDWGVEFQSFDSGTGTLDLSTSSTATQFSPTWRAKRTGSMPAYWVRVHLVSANAVNPALNDTTAFLGANCGPNITGCDATGTQACSYVAGSAFGTRRIDCGDMRGMSRSKDRAVGAYAVIGQVCYMDSAMNEVCAQKPAIPLTLR